MDFAAICTTSPVQDMPAKCQRGHCEHIVMLTLAFSLKNYCVSVKPHTAASMEADCCV